MSIWEAFQMGGWGMFPTLGFGLAAIGVAIRYAVAPSRRYVPLLVALGIVTLTSGTLGFVTGFIKSVSAVAESGTTAPVLALIGAGEALHCIALALLCVMFAGMAGAAGAYRISRGEAEPDAA